MDNIKIAQVPGVTMIRLGVSTVGTLHLTAHHMIFRQTDGGREVWTCYPIISEVIRHPYSAVQGYARLRIACKDFTFLALNFTTDGHARDVYDSLVNLTASTSPESLYAFMYKPGALERKLNGWSVYDPVKEYARMNAIGPSGKWRVTHINKDYAVSPSYPSVLIVPETISDNVLNYAAKYRSKCRLPVLSYHHNFNKCTITRCSQPLVGLKKNRSVQDEKLVMAVFGTTAAPEGVVGFSRQENLVVDARPTTNAMAQTALGGGSESMDNYQPAKKKYLGIDNIHVMRDSMSKIVDSLRNGDLTSLPPIGELLHKSHWTRHCENILSGSVLVARQVHYKFSHVILHCSDGWDRTPQVSSLAQIMLDPYFRTIDGFIVLVEKEWLSFGHRFAERSQFIPLTQTKMFPQSSGENNAQNLLNNMSSLLPDSSRVKYSGPVFHQFLDCVYQIVCQFPSKFEYNERFLRRLLYHVYSCQYGTFLFNSESERRQADLHKRTRSVWDYFLARKEQFASSEYVALSPDASIEDQVIFPNPKTYTWWAEVFGRAPHEMNGLDNSDGFISRQSTPRLDTDMPASTASAASTRPPSTSRPATPVSVPGSGATTESSPASSAASFPTARLGATSPRVKSGTKNYMSNTLVSYAAPHDDSSQLNVKFDSMVLDMAPAPAESGRSGHTNGVL